MNFLKLNGQQKVSGPLQFPFIDEQLHAALDDALVLERVYSTQPSLPFGDGLDSHIAQHFIAQNNDLGMHLQPGLVNGV